MELRDSSDRAMADVNARVETGRKWRAKDEVQKVMGRLQHQQIVGMIQTLRTGLGGSEQPILWSKASRKKRTLMLQSSPGLSRRSSEWPWEGVASRAIS